MLFKYNIDMATHTFSKLRIYDSLSVRENFEENLGGIRITPTTVNNRADDVTGYILKAADSNGKVIWAPGTSDSYSLSDLTNTSLNLTVSDKSVLTFNAASGNWIASQGVSTIGQLSNVDLTGITDNSILIYNSTASEFQIGALPDITTPGGQEGSIQFKNSSGDLAGDNTLLWDNSVKELTFDVASKIIIGGLTIQESDITGLPAIPTNNTSAVSKSYLQTEIANLATGLNWKEMVEYATVESDNYSASEMATLTSTGSTLLVDNVSTFNTGTRILFKNNSSAEITNGIYTVTTAAHPNYIIARSTDLSTGPVSGTVLWVDSGAVNEGYSYFCNSPTGSDVVDVDPLTFVEFNANTSDVIVAGQGLEKVSNAYNVRFNTSTFNVITDNKLDINDTGVVSGSYGSGTVVPVISVNAKGQLTGVSTAAMPVATTSTSGILSSTDFDSFANRLDATSLADGYLWVGSNGTGASQKQISGDLTIGSDGTSTLTTVSGLPIVPFPTNFTASTVKIAKLSVNEKGIVTTLTEESLPVATSTNNGILSSANWTTFNSKLSSTLTTGKIFVGSGAGTAISKTLTGDATIDDNGVLSLEGVINAGTVGNSTSVPVLTYDNKGRIVSATNVGIPSASASVKGLLTAADHIAFTNKMPNTLANGKLFIGTSNVATPQTVSGDITLSETGVATLATIHTTVPVIDYTTNLVIPRVQTNAKGLVTSITAQTVPTVSDTVTGVLSHGDYVSFKNKLASADFIGNAKIMIGNGETAESVTVSGDVTLSNTGRIDINSTIQGDKIIPGDISFTSAAGDSSSSHTDTNISVTGSLGVTGKTYLNGPVTADVATVSTLNIGTSTFTSGRITNIADPQTDTDAVNKQYVDNSALGIKWIEPVILSTTSNITSLSTLDPLSNGGKIDNVQLLTSQRILVKDQDNKELNGVYVITASTWTRASDMPENANISNYAMFVKSGDSNGASAYVATGSPLVVSVNDLTFTLFSKSTSVSAGTGLSGITKLSVKTDDVTVTKDPTTGSVRLKEIGSVSGSYGSSLNVPSMSTDKYGRVLAIANTPIQYASYTNSSTKTPGIITGDNFNTFTNKINQSALTTAGNILVGSGAAPVSVQVSGDATLSTTGTMTLTSIHTPAPTATNTGITVPDIVIDSKGRITSLSLSTIDYASSSTPGILTASDYVAFSEKLDSDVLTTDTHILIGDGATSNSVALTGDVTVDNTGLVTISNSVSGDKTFTGVLTANEIVITEAEGITAPLVTTTDMTFTGSLSSTSGTVTVGAVIITDGKIEGLAPPSAGTDAANRDYVDQASSGINWQDPADTRAGSNITVFEVYHVTNNPTGPTLITGVSSSAVGGHILSLNDRVLVDSQNINKEDQGMYYVSTVTGGTGSDVHLQRSTDFPDGVNVSGFAVYIQSGTYEGLSYTVASSPATINTDTPKFSTFAGSSSFTAGIGTSKDVNSLNVNYDDVTIGIADNNLYIKNSSIGSAKLLDNAVTPLKLANNSVTTVKILDGSVTGAKLSSGSITNSMISNTAAIATSKLSVSKWTLDTTSDITLTGTSVANKVGLGETAKFSINGSKVVKTTTAQTVGGAKTFSDNTKISSTTELIKDTDTSALTVFGGAVVKKNFQSKNVYTENAYISSTATIGSVDINGTDISGVNAFVSTTVSTDVLNVGSTIITGNELTGVTKVSGLVSPVANTDATNKLYVDDSISEFTTRRNTCKCTTSGSLGNPPTGSYTTSLTNGVTLVTGDRVLVKNQGNIENGIYVVDTLGTWSRATDYPSGGRADGLSVYVENAKQTFVCTNVDSIVGSAILVFEQLIMSGNGITTTENVVSVSLHDSSLIFDSGNLKVGTVPITSLSASSISVSGSGITVTDASDSIITSAVLGQSLKMAVKLQTDSGLEVTSNGLKVLPVSNTRLENSSITLSTGSSKGIIFKDTNSNEVSSITLGDTIVPEIKLQSGSGLTVTNAGLAVVLPVDFVTNANVIELDGSKLTNGTVSNDKLVNGTTEINVKTGSGIEVSNDDASTYEDNGTVSVALGAELNLKLSDNVTRNNNSSPFTTQKSFTDTTASNSKITGAVTVTGGLGVGGALHSSTVVSDSGTIGGIVLAAGKVTGITSTVNATDAASKNYVDSLTFGLRWTVPVDYATTGAIGVSTYSSLTALTVDGNSSWTVGDRILVSHEGDLTNGIYEVTSEVTGTVILARASDLAVTTGATGLTLYVSSGSVNAGVGFTCTEESPAVVFVQFTSGDTTDAGNGLGKAGNVVSVIAADSTIISDNTGVKIGTVPLSALESSTHTIVPGAGLVTVFKESDDTALRSDAVLGGFTYIDLSSNVVLKDASTVFTLVTDSVSTSTGAVTLAGGLGVAKGITAATLTATTLTDGTATLVAGALSGITTADFSEDITLSKSTSQLITAENGVTLASTSGTTTIESVIFDEGDITAVESIAVSGSVTLGGLVLSPTGITGATSVSVSTDPASNNELSRKSYVDTTVTSSKNSSTVKDTVSFATSGNRSPFFSGISNVQGIDIGTGTLVIGQRVLVKNQSTLSENGIYIAGSGTWARASDFNPGKIGDTTTVIYGTTNGKKTYMLKTGSEFELINAPGAGITSVNAVDYDDVTLNLSGNKLQIKAVTPALITDRTIKYTYGDGIKSTGIPLMGATGSFPVLSVDYDDVTIMSSAGKLAVKAIPNSLLATDTITVQNSNNISFVNESDSPITSVALGSTLSAKIKLASNSGLKSTASGLEIDTAVITDKLAGITSSQITSLDANKLTGTVSNALLTSNTFGVFVGKGIYAKNSGGSDVSSVPLGGSLYLTVDTLDPTLPQTFTKTVTFSDNVTTTTKSTGALIVSNGGLGVNGKIVAGGQIESEIGFKAGSVIMSGTSGLISGLSNPLNSSDAATKSYVDNAVNGSKWKTPVRCATNAIISNFDDLIGNGLTLTTNPHTYDGIVVALNDRILVKNQSNETENGIYVVSSYISSNPTYTAKFTRVSDLPIGDYAAGVAVFVNEGTVNAKAGFVCNNDFLTSVVNTHPMTWTQISGSAIYSGNKGLTLTGSEFNLNVQVSQFEFSGSTLNIKPSGITQNELGTSSVITTKILDSNVTNAKLQFSSHVVEAGTGLKVKKNADISYLDTVTPNLGDTITFKVDDTVVLSNLSSQTISGTIALTDSTSAINTSTGALTVAGGVGVTGTVHCGTLTTGTVTGTTFTDGTATLAAGALSGATTAEFSDDITLSKSTPQTIIAASGLTISSTSSVVTVEGVEFNAGAIAGATTADFSDDITLSKSAPQTITATNGLTLASTNSTVTVESVIFDGSEMSGISTAKITDSLTIGSTSGSKAEISVQAGGGNTTVDFKIPSSQGGVGSVLRNDGTGVMTWVKNNVLYSRTVIDTNNYGNGVSNYNATILDDIIAVLYTSTGPVNITLPLVSSVGELTLRIVDEGGNAATNNITVSGSGSDTILGQSNIKVSGNYNSYVLYNNGVNGWFVV